MKQLWSDSEGITALKGVFESISALADAAHTRRELPDETTNAAAPLAPRDLPDDVRFARMWPEHGGPYLARRPVRACPLCGSDERVPWFETQDGYRYDSCERCRMVYIPEVVTLQIWDQYFADLPEARRYKHGQMERHLAPAALEADRERFGRYYRLMAEHGAPLTGARFLDVGTYTGAAVKIAGEFGMEAYGVEGVEETVQFCRANRPELRIAHVHAEDLTATTYGGQFNYITMWETLEHAFDPKRALQAAWDALAPDGLVAVSVPNVKNTECAVLRQFCYWACGGYMGVGHLNLYSPDTLRRAFEDTGFELVHIETEFGTDWKQVAYYLQHRFDRIHCYRNLIKRETINDTPDSELALLLNWLAPALTRLENAMLAGPIIVAIARRRAR